MDRRVARTRRLLGEALLKLVQEKGFDDITIRELTERADVGYATFFRHYDGKEEVLSEQLEQMIRQLERMAGEHTEDYFQREGTLFYRHIEENELLFRSLLAGNVNARVLRRLRDALVRVIRPHMERHSRDVALRVPLEIAVNHVAASALELAGWWLENGMPYRPEEMGRIYRRLIIEGTWHAILPSGGEEGSAGPLAGAP